jgi:hypothetical protein
MEVKNTDIYSKLFNIQQEIGALSKDTSNPYYKSKYFDINSLIKQLQPILTKNKILLIQPIIDNMVCSRLICLEDGGSIDSTLTLPQIDDAQKIGSAITYYRRYTLTSLLGLQADDDDANLASGKILPKKFLNFNTNEYNKAIEFVKGGGNIIDIKKKYNISKEVELELNKL